MDNLRPSILKIQFFHVEILFLYTNLDLWIYQNLPQQIICSETVTITNAWQSPMVIKYLVKTNKSRLNLMKITHQNALSYSVPTQKEIILTMWLGFFLHFKKVIYFFIYFSNISQILTIIVLHIQDFIWSLPNPC